MSPNPMFENPSYESNECLDFRWRPSGCKGETEKNENKQQNEGDGFKVSFPYLSKPNPRSFHLFNTNLFSIEAKEFLIWGVPPGLFSRRRGFRHMLQRTEVRAGRWAWRLKLR